jgi:hypothetical protein
MDFSQTLPNLTASTASWKVWSSTDMMAFDPTIATWSAGVITIKEVNHGLSGGETVNVSCANAASLWNIGNVVCTKIDKDTFTVPLAGDPGVFPNSNPYPANYVTQRVTVSCSAYSKTFFLSNYLQIENLGGATNLKIQAKLNANAPWVDTTQTTLVVGITKITDPLNFLRITSGTGTAGSTVSVYVQK